MIHDAVCVGPHVLLSLALAFAGVAFEVCNLQWSRNDA